MYIVVGRGSLDIPIFPLANLPIIVYWYPRSIVCIVSIVCMVVGGYLYISILPLANLAIIIVYVVVGGYVCVSILLALLLYCRGSLVGPIYLYLLVLFLGYSHTR